MHKAFQIQTKDIGKLTIKEIGDQYDTGNEIKPAVWVEIDPYTPLTLNQDSLRWTPEAVVQQRTQTRHAVPSVR